MSVLLEPCGQRKSAVLDIWVLANGYVCVICCCCGVGDAPGAARLREFGGDI